jgi:glycosyltransferase involved in cell wall biosynthesis
MIARVARLAAEIGRISPSGSLLTIDYPLASGDISAPRTRAGLSLSAGITPVQNQGLHGFGRAIICGLDRIKGDAVVIMMADESDDCRDVVRYWDKLNEGFDCVFGSRFIKGGSTIDYPAVKYVVNRLANFFIKLLFRIPLNDTTNAFKAYRREVIDGCRPLIAPHFNLTVEIPLKAVVCGYPWTVVPTAWRNRRFGAHCAAALKILRPEVLRNSLDQNILRLEHGGPFPDQRCYLIAVKFAWKISLPWIDYSNGIVKRRFADHHQFVITQGF